MGIYISKGRTERRAAHWKDIQSRVTTHEGELLSGKKGREYQEKYSKKYLGRDLSKPGVDVRDVERYEKTVEDKNK